MSITVEKLRDITEIPDNRSTVQMVRDFMHAEKRFETEVSELLTQTREALSVFRRAKNPEAVLRAEFDATAVKIVQVAENTRHLVHNKELQYALHCSKVAALPPQFKQHYVLIDTLHNRGIQAGRDSTAFFRPWFDARLWKPKVVTAVLSTILQEQLNGHPGTFKNFEIYPTDNSREFQIPITDSISLRIADNPFLTIPKNKTVLEANRGIFQFYVQIEDATGSFTKRERAILASLEKQRTLRQISDDHFLRSIQHLRDADDYARGHAYFDYLTPDAFFQAFMKKNGHNYTEVYDPEPDAQEYPVREFTRKQNNITVRFVWNRMFKKMEFTVRPSEHFLTARQKRMKRTVQNKLPKEFIRTIRGYSSETPFVYLNPMRPHATAIMISGEKGPLPTKLVQQELHKMIRPPIEILQKKDAFEFGGTSLNTSTSVVTQRINGLKHPITLVWKLQEGTDSKNIARAKIVCWLDTSGTIFTAKK